MKGIVEIRTHLFPMTETKTLENLGDLSRFKQNKLAHPKINT